MLKAFSKKLFGIFTNSVDEDFFENIEDLLIESDLGGTLSFEISDKLREVTKKKKIDTLDKLKDELYHILSEYVIEEPFDLDKEKLNLVLFLGVNGVGKTTTIGRIAHYFKNSMGVEDIVLSAGDTFRAAAIDQLKIHGERTGNRVVAQEHGADPGAVIFDTIKSAQAKNEKLILADTAGRMHNRKNLIMELEKIDRIVLKSVEEKNYKKILVIDCTTGQNGLNQAIDFHNAVNIDGVILTKYDSSAKGGIIPAVCNKIGVPFYFLGVGEGIEDLIPFNKDKYIKELIGIQ